ncbi:hypothetical protein [Euzebya sp.]|uniref:hypothetical protein n=1 Tax=Euzebya sp. TaxID=1971409 RepID=UPI0035121AD4
MSSIIALYTTAQMLAERGRDRLRAEEGQTSVEWLGIAAVIVAIVVFIAGDLSEGIAGTIRDAFEGLIGRASGADGG